MTNGISGSHATFTALALGLALGVAVAAEAGQAPADQRARGPAAGDTATGPGAGRMMGPGGMMGGPGMMRGQTGMMEPGPRAMGPGACAADGECQGMMGAPWRGAWAPGAGMMHRGGDAPMSVTINIGPGIRVEAEDDDTRGPGAWPGPRRGMMGPGMMGARGAAMDAAGARWQAARIEGTLAYARAALDISAEQAPRWDTFANAVRQAASKLREAYAHLAEATGQPATVPERLEQRIALQAARLEAMQGVSAAAGPLYAGLSETQQQTADALLAAHLGGMRGAMP